MFIYCSFSFHLGWFVWCLDVGWRVCVSKCVRFTLSFHNVKLNHTHRKKLATDKREEKKYTFQIDICIFALNMDRKDFRIS